MKIPRLNRKQTVVLRIALGLLVLFCVFPPWTKRVFYWGTWCLTYYGPIWTDEASATSRIAVGRLAVQCLAVLLIAAGLIFQFRARQTGKP